MPLQHNKHAPAVFSWIVKRQQSQMLCGKNCNRDDTLKICWNDDCVSSTAKQRDSQNSVYLNASQRQQHAAQAQNWSCFCSHSFRRDTLARGGHKNNRLLFVISEIESVLQLKRTNWPRCPWHSWIPQYIIVTRVCVHPHKSTTHCIHVLYVKYVYNDPLKGQCFILWLYPLESCVTLCSLLTCLQCSVSSLCSPPPNTCLTSVSLALPAPVSLHLHSPPYLVNLLVSLVCIWASLLSSCARSPVLVHSWFVARGFLVCPQFCSLSFPSFHLACVTCFFGFWFLDFIRRQLIKAGFSCDCT